ncbi:MAG: DUF547 domain-containing protein [Bythopirellula sp.]
MRTGLAMLVGLLLMVTSQSLVVAGTQVKIVAAVPAARQLPIDQISHQAWNELLGKYCDEQGYVDYQGWQKSATDLQRLDAYLAHLAQANPTLSASTASKFAFWINAYNAVTIKGILREYPTTSIRNHTAKLVGYNIWDDLLLTVGGKDYSLNQMEHEVLRKQGDPRIHFAIVCASISCPPLLSEAYKAEKIDNQLTASAKRFFADPTKFVATDDGQLKLSEILQWFAKDFGADQAAQLRTIAPFLPTAGAQALATSGRARISYLNYDWGLNDQATKKLSRR